MMILFLLTRTDLLWRKPIELQTDYCWGYSMQPPYAFLTIFFFYFSSVMASCSSVKLLAHLKYVTMITVYLRNCFQLLCFVYKVELLLLLWLSNWWVNSQLNIYEDRLNWVYLHKVNLYDCYLTTCPKQLFQYYFISKVSAYFESIQIYKT